MEAQHDEALREELEQMRLEVSELRASRRRLVQAADDDRARLERDLHEGVQQHLIALAVNLQLARSLADSDSAGARGLLEEMERDVQRAIDEAARLAQWIYAPLLEAGGLGAALRSAAASAGVPASVEVATSSSYSPEVARTIFLCWIEALESNGRERRATVTLRDGEEALGFEIVGGAARSEAGLDRLRQRIEALGGQVTVRSEPAGTRLSGSLPLSARS